ncbi:uncharacterized protein LOC115629596 [Scaptodrosophila lebanonensis]|uniref:Uncharacterized protein LOC115629596 n=1 Tax=Drosophila lebanonensis TaxID=7225 RepID=A0A6J2U268_DROLE|nr:uncharacterized protein LOC115629596 [Scaptodrosophila lebanonensis]
MAHSQRAFRPEECPKLTLTLAVAVVHSSDAPSTTNPTKSTNATKTSDASKATTEKPTQPAATRQSKALKPTAGENRGKRTLYDFGNAGYLYRDVANRRAGYVDSGSSYYPQAGFYNGQNAIAQYPGAFTGGYAPYPQYLEAPEPIIEIIIKDANETLSEEPVQPILSKKKKKKEKVHVFYVNYKKDQNNKLHLETPIASLNNDDNEEEEEEEEEQIVQYPVTPLPPVKTTTLRTIIHPDSEKYHSNSGIHVSFGAEDLRQSGHILEEHDAESIQRQVVALPAGPGVKTEGYVANTRADYGRDNSFGRAPVSNFLFGGASSNSYHQAPPALHFHSQQQPPVQHSTNYFRPPAALIGAPTTSSQQLPKPTQQQHFYKPQQQQQQPHQQQQQHQHAVERPNFTHQQLPATSSQIVFNKLLQQSQYYVNHNQQYHQPHSQQPQQQQQHHHQYFKTPASTPSKQVPFFPTIPPKTHELPSRQSPASYQPVKFRPTPAAAAQIKPVPVPVKLENVNYQQQQSQYQQQQPKPLPSYQFTRQPQFVQQPHFTVRAPTPPPDYYQLQQQQQQQQQQQHGLQNYFDIAPSKETELLKSIPKFEQHITETIQNPIVPSPQQQSPFGYSSTRNEVIHDIPAPNLAPTSLTQQLTGHYITASSTNAQQQQQQQQQRLPQSSQVALAPPPVYAESTHGQKVMVVTPVPPQSGPSYATYNQYQQLHASTGSLQAQASTNFVQQPRQTSTVQISAAPATDNSPFSVSTYHSDVFKELEQRQKEQRQQQAQQPGQVSPTVATKTVAAPTTGAAPSGKASQTLLQLPDEVPDDLRQQLFSSGILNNADISVLDYDKVGDIALENLPAEHLQHFYGAGGGAQIAETNKVLTVVKPNGDKVALSEKDIEKVKQSNSLPQKQNLDVKVVRFDAQQGPSVSEKYVRTDATVVTPVDLADRQYNRYLPLKINGAQFPIPESQELVGKKIVSVVVLAPVEAQAPSTSGSAEARSVDTKEVKFLGGDLIKTLVKKPTKDNFKRWLEKESRTDIELQSVVLLVVKSSEEAEQEIFMYDIATGNINKLNGELSSTFVNVAEENASSEDLEHAATLDHTSLESMMHRRRRR